MLLCVTFDVGMRGDWLCWGELCGKRNFKRRRRQFPLVFFYLCGGQVWTVVVEHANLVCLFAVEAVECLVVVVDSCSSATTTSLDVIGEFLFGCY